MSRRNRSQDVTGLSTTAVFDTLRNDYNAAKTSRLRRRLTGYRSSGSGFDYHVRVESDFLRMLELARSFDRNDPFVGQLVTRAVDNIVRDGISLDPQTGDSGLDEELRQRWEEWGDDPRRCHSSGTLTWGSLQRLILRSEIVDGDVFLVLQSDGAIRPVEAHRCRKPKATKRNVVHGILMDESRRRLEYWFTRDDINPNSAVDRVSDMVRIPAFDADGYPNVLHVYDPRRFSQTRGVTAFAPVVDLVSAHDDIQLAKLLQQQVASCFAIFRERPETMGEMGATVYGEQSTETLSDGSTRTLEGIAPGMEVIGNPGEKLSGFSPNIPNPEYFTHVDLVLKLIAVNLGLPLKIALLDSTQTNFSAWRGATDMARIGFRVKQDALVDFALRPVWLWRLRHMLRNDADLLRRASASGVNITGHAWTPRGWDYIEPLKDTKADRERVDGNLISMRRLQAEKGRDWDRMVNEIVADRVALVAACIRAAEELNAKHPNALVDWRELAGAKPSLSVGDLSYLESDDNDESDGQRG